MRASHNETVSKNCWYENINDYALYTRQRERKGDSVRASRDKLQIRKNWYAHLVHTFLAIGTFSFHLSAFLRVCSFVCFAVWPHTFLADYMMLKTVKM